MHRYIRVTRAKFGNEAKALPLGAFGHEDDPLVTLQKRARNCNADPVNLLQFRDLAVQYRGDLAEGLLCRTLPRDADLGGLQQVTPQIEHANGEASPLQSQAKDVTPGTRKAQVDRSAAALAASEPHFFDDAIVQKRGNRARDCRLVQAGGNADFLARTGSLVLQGSQDDAAVVSLYAPD